MNRSNLIFCNHGASREKRVRNSIPKIWKQENLEQGRLEVVVGAIVTGFFGSLPRRNGVSVGESVLRIRMGSTKSSPIKKIPSGRSSPDAGRMQQKSML